MVGYVFAMGLERKVGGFTGNMAQTMTAEIIGEIFSSMLIFIVIVVMNGSLSFFKIGTRK